MAVLENAGNIDLVAAITPLIWVRLTPNKQFWTGVD